MPKVLVAFKCTEWGQTKHQTLALPSETFTFLDLLGIETFGATKMDPKIWVMCEHTKIEFKFCYDHKFTIYRSRLHVVGYRLKVSVKNEVTLVEYRLQCRRTLKIVCKKIKNDLFRA